MQLSTLRTDTRFLISPQLTSDAYTDEVLDRNLNTHYKTVVGWAMMSQGTWEVKADLVYRDVEEGVTVYDLPENLIRIFKGEIMYETGGSFVPLNFISVQANQGSTEGNATRVYDDSSRPTAELFSDSIEIRPAGDEDVVNGIKLWVQLVPDDMEEDADIPDLLEPVHRAISVMAAMDYCLSEDMYKKLDELRKMLHGDPSKRDDFGLKGDIENLYSVRTGTQRDNIGARRRRYN